MISDFRSMSRRKSINRYNPDQASDRQLVERAVGKAGGQQHLAQLFGVSQSAISEWGRIRPIPRHARARLVGYVDQTEDQAASRSPALLRELQGPVELLEEVHRLLHEQPSEIQELPANFRARYGRRAQEVSERFKEQTRANLTELASRVKRELSDFKARLLAEHRAATKPPPSPSP
jgi:hypothetical protein